MSAISDMDMLNECMQDENGGPGNSRQGNMQSKFSQGKRSA